MLTVNNRTYAVDIVESSTDVVARTAYGDWQFSGRGPTTTQAVELLRREIVEADIVCGILLDPRKP